MTENKTSSNVNLFVVLFALAALVTFVGTLLGFVAPSKETGLVEPQLAAICAGPLLGSLGGLGALWLRRRFVVAGKRLAGAIALWFLGVTLVMWGIFAAATPGSGAFAENIGYSIALCFAPGGILAGVGLLSVWNAWRRATATVATAGGAPVAAYKTPDEYADLRRRAHQYRSLIAALERDNPDGGLGTRLRAILSRVDGWESRIEELTRRLERFDRDGVLQRDAAALPGRIADLKERMAGEPDADVRSQMEETLAGYQEQRTGLEALFNLMRRTRLQLDETLAAMGAIYSNAQMVGALDADGGRAARISEDIQDQADRLADLLAAMREAYQPAAAQSEESESTDARGNPSHVYRRRAE